MRDDYKLEGKLKSVNADIEEVVADRLKAMTEHTKLTAAEIMNTALKRFIATHKDFFPPKRK